MSARRTPPAFWRFVVALFALSLFAAACGDDDDTTDESSSDPTTTAGDDEDSEDGDGASGSPITIGAIIDESGPQSIDTGVSRKVAEAWAASVNDDGGIAGHPVEIDFTDTGGDPSAGSAAVESYLADDAIAGVYILDAAGEAAFGPALSEGELPVIGGVGFNPTLWGALPYFYNVTTSFPQIVLSQAISAQENDAGVVAGAPCAEVPACKGSEQFFNKGAADLELENAGTIEISGSAVDYNAECLQYIGDDVGFIQLSLTNETAIRLANDCLGQGYDGVFGVSATTVTAGLYEEDIPLAGGLNAFPWYADSPAIENYRSVMEDAGVSSQDFGNTAATGTWTTLELFRVTMEANAELLDDDDLTRDEVITAYATVADEDLDGLISMPISFDESGISQPNTCFWLYTAEGGEISGSADSVCLDDYGVSL